MSPSSPPTTRRDPFFCEQCEKMSETVFVIRTARGSACWPCLRHYLAELEEQHGLLLSALDACEAAMRGSLTVAQRELRKDTRETIALVRERRR